MTDAAYLDTEAVATWLESHLKGFQGPLSAEKYAVGQSNPTFKLTSPSGTYVLRRKPPGVLLKSAHAVDREFRVQKALESSDVPVAKMHLLCEDDAVIGSSFYIMERIDGRNFDNPSLPEIGFEERRPVLEEMNRVLAAIHSVDLQASGLDDYGPAGNYYARQIDRWTKQYRASETETIEAMDTLITWLNENIPAEDSQRTLVHGDYRIDNMLFSKTGPSCLAVWIGNCLRWGILMRISPRSLCNGQCHLAIMGVVWLVLIAKPRGLSKIKSLLMAIVPNATIGIDNFGFYLAFCCFRMAGIIQGVKKRALDGNASNPERALQMGKYVHDFAKAGLKAASTL